MKTEADIENAVVRYAERRGIFHTKLNIMLHRSLPDRVFWIPGGRPLLIEFKKRGKEPTKLQWITLRKLEALGYDIGWTDKAEEAIEWIDSAIGFAKTGKADRSKTARLSVARSGVASNPRRRGPVRKSGNG